jgi:hypothetical protein
MAEPRIQWSVLSTIGIWIVSALLAWGVVQTRVAVLEERVDQIRADLVELKADVKTLLRRGQ